MIAVFVLLIFTGTVMLALPGVLPEGRLAPPDALFLAVSAVTLTGLTPVAITGLSSFGLGVLLVLFQAAGILVITFSTVFLARPGARRSRSAQRVVRERWLEFEELNPARLLPAVAVSTLAIEAAGAAVLYLSFRTSAAVENPLFTAVFHAVSAFCNAGFSTFPVRLSGFPHASAVPITLMALVVLGGLGYVVLRALFLRVAGGRQVLGFHSRLVLAATFLLLASGAALYYLFENLPPGAGVGKFGWLDALFQAVTVRTAGFDLAAHRPAAPASTVLTVALMLVGGAPGSAAGGLKITTVVTVVLVAVRGLRPRGRRIALAHRRLSRDTQGFAAVYLLRALLLFACCVLMLAVTETWFNSRAGLSAGSLFFETASAFTTTGLSSGVTPLLSAPGKAVIMVTMLAGRLGLLAMVARMSDLRRPRNDQWILGEGEVFFGG